jgi:hypothetical protein
MTTTQIEVIQTQIEELFSSPWHHHSHNDMMETLTQVTALLGNCAKCISESKRIELTKRGEHARKYMDLIQTMKPSIAKEFISTACIPEQILSLRCDRNYSALTKAGENLRSILSAAKEEMKLTG